jgi:hypothetical protein
MELGAINFSNITASGAFARVYFAIKEAAQKPLIQQQITDYGHMVCAMVKIQGTWRCQKLTINFYDPAESANPVNSAPMVARGRAYQTRTGTQAARGFSFGSFVFD